MSLSGVLALNFHEAPENVIGTEAVGDLGDGLVEDATWLEAMLASALPGRRIPESVSSVASEKQNIG